MRVRVCVQFFQTCQPRVKKKRRRNSKYDLKRRLTCFSSERPSPGSDRMIKAVHMLRRINWQRQFPHGLVHSPAFSGQLFILTETPQQKNNRLNFSPPFFLQVSPLFSWITGYRLLFVITYRGREMWINVENPWWIQIFPYRAWEPIKKINMLCSFSYVPDHNTDLQVTARCTLLPILDFCPSATTLVDFFLNVWSCKMWPFIM